MKEHSLITIIIATYNRAHLILDTLKTIREQTYGLWECLIIDDGGTDNTNEVITPFLNNDNRFKYLKRKDNYKKGLCGCRNYGLDIAKGDFIIFFDDDDIIHPKNLEISFSLLNKSEFDFCHYQKHSFINEIPVFETKKTETIGYINQTNIEDIVTNKIGLASCTVLWRKSCFNSVRFNENLHYAEEWECYIKIISKNFKGLIINNILYFNRKHANSNTGEFWNKNPKRIASKKEANYLVLKNLKEMRLLSTSIMKFIINNSINLRDKSFYDKLIIECDLSFKQKMFFDSKYYLLPLWKLKKSINKK